MRSSRSALGAFFIALALCAHASAAASTIVRAYARVIRAFNPQLGDEVSRALARSVIAEADARGLDARLLVAVVAVESSWRVGAVSPAGALGLGQLMPSTAARMGVDPLDPYANIHGVAVHLRALLDRYAANPAKMQYVLALAAYNAGTAAVGRYGGVPPYPQTRAYVARVMALWRRLAGAED